MSCSPFDLRDYFLQELARPQQLQVEAHIAQCAACHEEAERLQATGAALFSLREEEIPQRIGFVSDKIFEPSPARRWFAAFWGSTARLAFASAAMLSVAMVFSAWHRTPAPATGPVGAAAQVAAPPQSLTPQEIDQRIQQAVVKAVAGVEARYQEQNRVQLAEFRKAGEEARNRLMIAESFYTTEQKRSQVRNVARMVRPGDEAGEPK